MVPAWILESPLKAGIATMEAGGRLGLAARAQDAQEQEAANRLGLSFAEMEQRRQDAAARLAESLRAQTALEQYRQSEIANQQALRQQAKDTAAAMALRQAQQQENWDARFNLDTQKEARMAEAAAEAQNFTPGNAEAITLPDGTVVGHRWQRSPRVWESIKEPPAKSTELTPTAKLNALVRIASASPHLAAMDTTSPLYPGATNALAQANALLTPPVPTDSAIPNSPINPQLRRAGQTYKTPKGVFKWTGSGWQTSE